MKKIMMFLLLIMAILAFAACEKEEENPYVGIWKDVFDENTTVVLNADGTGEFGSYKIINWVQEEDKIKAEVETAFLPVKVDFMILDFGGEIVLSETPNGFEDKYLLIKLDKYSEESVNTVKQVMKEQSEEWNFFDYTNTKLDNEVKAELEYNDKLVKWTAKVYDIDGTHCQLYIDTYNGLPLNSVDAYLSIEDLASLNSGDTITVVGFIEVGGIGTDLFAAYIVENHGQQ